MYCTVATESVLFKMAAAAISDFKKTAAISSLFDRSSPKFANKIGTSIWNTSMTSETRSFKTQDGGRRQFGFRKTLAISLLIDRSSSTLLTKLRHSFRAYRYRPKCVVAKNPRWRSPPSWTPKTVAISMSYKVHCYNTNGSCNHLIGVRKRL